MRQLVCGGRNVKRALTDSVRSQHSDARVHVDRASDLVQEDLVVMIPELDVAAREDVALDPVGFGEREGGLVLLHHVDQRVHLGKGLDARLHQRRALGVVAEFVDELLDVSSGEEGMKGEKSREKEQEKKKKKQSGTDSKEWVSKRKTMS